MGAVGVWGGIPALLSPFTLTLTLSHQGRGDDRGGQGLSRRGGILPFTPPPRGHPLRSLRSASPYALRRGRWAPPFDGHTPLAARCLLAPLSFRKGRTFPYFVFNSCFRQARRSRCLNSKLACRSFSGMTNLLSMASSWM